MSSFVKHHSETYIITDTVIKQSQRHIGDLKQDVFSRDEVLRLSPPFRVILALSVYFTTLFLDRFSPLSCLPGLVHILSHIKKTKEKKNDNCPFDSAEIWSKNKRKEDDHDHRSQTAIVRRKPSETDLVGSHHYVWGSSPAPLSPRPHHFRAVQDGSGNINYKWF